MLTLIFLLHLRQDSYKMMSYFSGKRSQKKLLTIYQQPSFASEEFLEA